MKRKIKSHHKVHKSKVNKTLLYILAAAVALALLIYALVTTRVHAAFSTITFHDATSANTGSGASSITFTKPLGVQIGDLMIVQIVANGAASNIYTPPAGWNFIRRDNTSALIGDALYYKVATTSEPTTYTFGFSSSQKASGGLAAYGGVDTTNPIDSHTGSVNLNVGTPLTAKSVTTKCQLPKS